MKQRALESGLLQILRMYVISSAILLPLGWRTFSPMLGVEAKPDRFFPASMPVMLFLVIMSRSPGGNERWDISSCQRHSFYLRHKPSWEAI
jgi:hypothetical protein